MPPKPSITSPKEDKDLKKKVERYLKFTRDMTLRERIVYVRKMLDQRKLRGKR